ncbi:MULTISPECIES: hypothetical protein [Streptomyces]|uniref:hypothetical protein n=1 Tax=Streptomyces TaxID=1883 RepID=UPI0004CD0BAC|nr:MULTISPECIES: hypothetical protein [Streptomyces]KOT57090.1 hypothetical protein ADK43_21935 [Streptomyces rimosus subsp. rimosus]
MADFTSETVTHTVHRWIIPAPEPWGAAAEEISKAWAVAAAAYRQAYGIDSTEQITGDVLRFHVRDTAIVIEYASEERA